MQYNGKEHREEKKEFLSGVFSNQQVRKVGTGTTTRKTIQKSFWFCQEQEDGQIEAQLLNTNYIPAGPKKLVSKEEFLEIYAPEPEFYVSNVFPKMRELNKTVARADRHRNNKEYYSAEMEYGNALKLDVENVRANFGLGITYLERGETAKAENIMERLVKLDAAFDREHKHLFNEFGIDLRKNGMLDQALKYYDRALELSDHDENLFYNIARVYLEKKDIPDAIRYIGKAVELNPRHEVSVKFLFWLVQKKLVPTQSQEEAARYIKRIKEARDNPGVEASPEESLGTGGDGGTEAAGAPSGGAEGQSQGMSPADSGATGNAQTAQGDGGHQPPFEEA